MSVIGYIAQCCKHVINRNSGL